MTAWYVGGGALAAAASALWCVCYARQVSQVVRERREAEAGEREFMQKMIESFSKGTGGKMGQSMENAFTYIKEINGIPVLSRELNADGSVESESTLKSAEKRDIAPKDLAVPDGYRQQQMPGM